MTATSLRFWGVCEEALDSVLNDVLIYSKNSQANNLTVNYKVESYLMTIDTSLMYFYAIVHLCSGQGIQTQHDM